MYHNGIKTNVQKNDNDRGFKQQRPQQLQVYARGKLNTHK